jgi:hypothetical protein
MNDLFSRNKTKDMPLFNPLSLQFSAGVPQVSRHLFTTKLSPLQKRYADLDIFRRQVEESKAGLHHQPYTMNKKNTHFYRSIFLGFAVLFFFLSVTIMAIPSALGCGFFFSSCSFLKTILVTICTLLFLTSLTVGLRLKAEKEAISYYMKRTKAHVAAIYARKRVRMGIKGVFDLFGPNRLKAASLRQLYHEVIDKMNDKKDETLHLVHRITTAETLDSLQKEDLLNQAIEEFNDKLHVLTNHFRHAQV